MRTIKLPTAKELWRRGLRVESEFYYFLDFDNKTILGENAFHQYTLCELLKIVPKVIKYENPYDEWDNEAGETLGGKLWRQYDAGEIEGVPNDINLESGEYYRVVFAESIQFVTWNIAHEMETLKLIPIKDDNITEAAGQLLIWLIDEGYYKITKKGVSNE
jgi:hypothetical protein